MPHNTTFSTVWPLIFGQLVYKFFGLAQSTDRKQYHDCMELCLTADDRIEKIILINQDLNQNNSVGIRERFFELLQFDSCGK